MEPHGNNPRQNVVAIIPARFGSSRLPGKMLLPVAGRPLILHTAARASEAESVSRVIVATDDRRISDVVEAAGIEAVMTAAGHLSGSDRIAEVAAGLPEGSIVVNVQGDEPTISPKTIDTAVDVILADPSADIVTTYEPLDNPEDVLDPNIVKVVADPCGRALYFSRSPVPFPREAVIRHGSLYAALAAEPALVTQFKKHTGLYVYRREFLLEYARMKPTPLELAEMLEQLRALENRAVIRVSPSAEPSIGVDTLADLDRVRAILESAEPTGVS